MATLFGTASRILDTIGTVADSVSKTVTATTSGIDMLESFVSVAKQKQEARQAADMENFYEILAADSALEIAQINATLEKELQSNPDVKQHYDIAHASLKATLDKIKSKYQPKD